MSVKQSSLNRSAIDSCGTSIVTVVSFPPRRRNVTLIFISLGVLLAGRPALVNDYLIITHSLRLNFSSCILTAMYFCALKSYRTAIVLHPLAEL